MKKGQLKDYVLDPDSKGGYRYTGEYYTIGVPEHERRRNGTLQLLGGVLELMLLLLALSVPCEGNVNVFVVIPAEFMLLCSALYISGSYAYRKCADRMEKRVYEKAILWTVQSVAVALALNAFSLLAQLVLLLRGSQEVCGDAILLGMLAVLFVCNFAALQYHRGLYGQRKA